MYDLGFPGASIWPLAFVGIALVLVSLRGRRAGGAFLVGLVAGLSFYLVHIFWATLYLGLLPWIALSTLEALFFGGGAVLIALAYRWVPRIWPGLVGQAVVVPVVVAGLWTLREFVAGNWPYGGFAWGRMALSQSQSPFAGLVAWVGISGLSFLMVALVAALIQLALQASVRGGTRALAGAIADGLAAREAGDLTRAEDRLGEAVRLAAESGHDDTAQLLGAVVHVLDAKTGTVRLRRDVQKADEMALDTASTKTTRIRP